MSERRGRIHEKHDLSKTRRCELLDVPRSSAYYRGESVSEADLAVMRLIDEIHLQLPFYGSRRMRDELEERGHMREPQVGPAPDALRWTIHGVNERRARDGSGTSIERANQAWA